MVSSVWIPSSATQQTAVQHRMTTQRRGLAGPPRAVTAVSCVLLAALCCATQAQAGTPWHAAYDLRMNATDPPLMLSAQNQTMLGVLMGILKDPHGAGAQQCVARVSPRSTSIAIAASEQPPPELCPMAGPFHVLHIPSSQ